MQLSSLSPNGVLNDEPLLWCDSTDAYGDGDSGTPGLPNGDCSPPVHVVEDFEVDPSWVTTGDWEWGVPDVAFVDGPSACSDGVGCYGTNLSGE